LSDSDQPRSAVLPETTGEVDETVWHRVAHVFARRLQEVEGLIGVAMALTDRTGTELREELESVAQSLTEQLEAVRDVAATAAARAREVDVPDSRFDELHRRIDAVVRELRAGEMSLQRRNATLPAPYGERVALTLGRRIEQVEGALAVTSGTAERFEQELREGLDEVDTAAAERTARVTERLTRFEARLRTLEAEGSLPDRVEHAVHELVRRIEEVERDRDALTSEIVRAREGLGAEQVRLQERVGELAARIVTGPLPNRAAVAGGTKIAWPSDRALDQLRIAVEGLRMRLAHHEKELAELTRGRRGDERIAEMQELLRGLESAGEQARSGRDDVLEQFERIAARMDRRLHQLETASSSGQ
jgi:chromosome segregation ATPase